MTIISILTALDVIGQQNPALFNLLDLTIKSSFIILLTLSINLALHRHSASTKSILWIMTFTALLFLPLFHHLIPDIPIPVAVDAAILANDSLTDTGVFLSRVSIIATNLFWVSQLYVLVCLGMGIYLLVGIGKVMFSSRHAVRFKNEKVEQLLQKLKEINGVHSPIDIFMSIHTLSPLTWGVFRHKIIFPMAAMNWDHKLLEQIIGHELGHIQRMDWLHQIVSRMAICVYWINPLVWLAHNKLIIESEKACDDAAIDDTGCSISYAENLMWLAGAIYKNKATIALAMLGKMSPLAERIQHILQKDARRHYINRSSNIPGLLFALLLAAPFAALNFSIQIIEAPIQENTLIPVKYFPKESLEFDQFMRELGRI